MKRRFHLLGAGLIVAALVQAMQAQAQENAGIARCRSLTISADRLNCYDTLSLPAFPATGRSYQAMSLNDLRLDQDSLRGHGVEVSGTLVPMGEVALLRSSDMDPSPLFVELKAIPREQRRTLLERCGMPGCGVTVRGLVTPVLAHPGIIADSLEIK